MNLFDKKLLFVVGKGGVGKSTVSLALAKAAANRGKKALVIAVNEQNYISTFYAMEDGIGYAEKNVEDRVSFCLLDPQNALHEYVLRQIKFELLYRYVFQNRVVQYFLDATPGLKDLLLLGKIVDLMERKGTKGYDLVIVDMPATGHGLNMLRLPNKVMSMISTGPLNRHAEHMHKVFANTKRTGICVVTLPEEMPVNECIEMIGSIQSEIDYSVSAVIANAVFPSIFQSNDVALLDEFADHSNLKNLIQSARRQIHREQSHRSQIDRLGKEIGDLPMVELPYIFDQNFSLSSIEQLANVLIPLEQNHG